MSIRDELQFSIKKNGPYDNLLIYFVYLPFRGLKAHECLHHLPLDMPRESENGMGNKYVTIALEARDET